MTDIRATGGLHPAPSDAPARYTLAYDALFGGTVYGVALNAAGDVRVALAEGGKPKPAPKAPVLFIKPRNTYLPDGGRLPLPAGIESVEVCAAVGVVFGRDTARVGEAEALHGIAGYVLAIDISEPGAGYFRPPTREKCRDGFLPIGSRLVPAGEVADPDALQVQLQVDGRTVASARGADMIRPLARLIADVSEFMTFAAGDVLLGVLTSPGPLARAGNRVTASATGLGQLECLLDGAQEGQP